MSRYAEDIIKLKSTGLSNRKIANILGCSISTVLYNTNDERKRKTNQRNNANRLKTNPLLIKLRKFLQRVKEIKKIRKPSEKDTKILKNKILTFHRNRKTKEYTKINFTLDDLIAKFGKNPKCYLTGKEIDIYQPRTYQFDHIIPTSKGGDNSIDNLGICTKEANMSKTDHTLEEFIELCKEVLINQGYNITKN